MRRKLPGTDLLIAFETAARHQSFTRAAEELSLTQSAVCRQISALEEFLGLGLSELALAALEDSGYHTIGNLPPAMLLDGDDPVTSGSVQAAVAALINQLAAPRLALKQGLPHLLVDFSRRLTAGQQARILIKQLRQ